MEFLQSLIFGSGTAHTIFVLSVVVAVGTALNKIKIGSISLGVTWILLAGIAAREMGLTIDSNILDFIRDFGLTLFVFSIGLQIGPGFFSSLRSSGLRLLWLSTLVMILCGILTYVLHIVTGEPLQTMVGIMDGAGLNTPAMGATQQTFTELTGVVDKSIPMSFAISYPFGVLATIIAFVVFRVIARINLTEEQDKYSKLAQENRMASKYSVEVLNEQIQGQTVGTIRELISRQFVISRVSHDNSEAFVADYDTPIHKGDKLFIVSNPEDKLAILTFLGKEINMLEKEWGEYKGELVSRKIIITRPEINGKKFSDLRLRTKYGINITRINRAGVDIIPYQSMELQLGDKVVVVGSDQAINDVSKLLGNSSQELHRPHVLTLFLGLMLGVLVGSITLFNIPQPIKLGLAAGPMLVAIILGRFGTHWHLITYTTLSANLMIREIGLSLFLAAVGLASGDGFIDAVIDGGYIWIAYALIIAIIPVCMVSAYAYYHYKMNIFSVMGVMAGSITNPIALEYTNNQAGNSMPAISYATVYPYVMFMRVVMAQMMLLFLM